MNVKINRLFDYLIQTEIINVQQFYHSKALKIE